ncbi:hypothetical protein C8J57DRAFT_1253137 [Mycena rebaudengoi]|nr:hypothetical protein C8J57DRAFT_1253137 [Mycena rebaudengoi]
MLPRNGMMGQPTQIPLAMASPTISMVVVGLAHDEWDWASPTPTKIESKSFKREALEGRFTTTTIHDIPILPLLRLHQFCLCIAKSSIAPFFLSFRIFEAHRIVAKGVFHDFVNSGKAVGLVCEEKAPHSPCPLLQKTIVKILSENGEKWPRFKTQNGGEACWRKPAEVQDWHFRLLGSNMLKSSASGLVKQTMIRGGVSFMSWLIVTVFRFHDGNLDAAGLGGGKVGQWVGMIPLLANPSPNQSHQVTANAGEMELK